MEGGRDGFAWGSALAPAPAGTPWEREGASFPADLFQSWIDCLTRPSEFFDSLDPEVSFTRPYLFFLITSVLGSGLGALSTRAVLGGWTAEYYAAQGLVPPGTAWSLFTFFLSPFLGTMALALNVAFVHVGVRLFVERPRPIGVTARTLCYVTAPQVLTLVPFLGWLVAPIWSFVLMVIGIRRTHDTTVGRSVAAVLIPPIVFWFALGMLFTVLVVFVVLAAGGTA
jgi:hypothetical protein